MISKLHVEQLDYDMLVMSVFDMPDGDVNDDDDHRYIFVTCYTLY